MQIDHRPGFDPDLLSKDFKSFNFQMENMCDHDEKMEDDREWCADSLAVELSSVESAAMAGVMSMLREPYNKGYVAAGNNRGDVANTLNYPAIDSNQVSMNQLSSRGATTGDSAYDSDEHSITSYCSASSSMLPNGRMRNRAASGATAPPSSPTATEDARGHTVTQFTTPGVNLFKPTPAARSYTGNTTTSNSSSNSHTSLHFRSNSEGRFHHHNDSAGAFLNTSPALSISIPTDRSIGYNVPRNQTHTTHTTHTQFREHDLFGVRGQETHSTDDTHMHTSPHPQRLPLGTLRAESYRVEEQGDDRDDAGSIASDQSLAVEVESVDEEGTYLSYGGDCGDFAPIAEYGSDRGSAVHGQHSQHKQQQYQQQYQLQYQAPCEYIVEDPDTPQSYTYGHSASSTRASTPQGRHSGFTQEESLFQGTELLPPSPQHLRRPQHRKSFLCEDPYLHAESPSSLPHQHQHHHQRGDSEASERSDARGDSASPSSIYERELHEHQRLHSEGYRYRATTPNNLNNNNSTTDSTLHASEARGGRSINTTTYFHNHYYPHTEHSMENTTTSHVSRPTSTAHNNPPPRRRKRTLKVFKVPYPPTTTHTDNTNTSIHSNNQSAESSRTSTADVAGVGKRKRDCGGDSSADEDSPHHPSGKKSNADYSFNFNRTYDCGPHKKQGSNDSLWSNVSHNNSNSSSNSNGNTTNNGSSDSTVNINMHHMYLDSPTIYPHMQN